MSRARDLANLGNNAGGLETLTVSDITDITVNASNINSATNQIIDSSTDLNIDSNTLVVDKSENKAGIGTTSPQDALHIVESSTRQLRLEGSAPSQYFKETDGTADQNYQLRLDGGNFLVQTNNDAFDSASTKLTINQSGKVGLGGDPTSALITGTGSGSDNAEIYLGATGTGNAGVVFDGSNGDFAGSDYYMLRQMNSLDVENWLGGSSDYIWKTASGTERMRLKSNGMTVHNGMYSYVRTFYQSLSSTVYYQFDIDNSVQYFYIKAMIGYYPGSAYTATYHVYAAFRSDSGIGVVNTLLNQTHSNSGSWSLSDNGVNQITVTKTGGASTAMAKGFIEVQWRDAT